jgi:predicted RNase H-like HicB family nuclease
MKFSVVIEKIEDDEIGIGYYYAHVPSLGLTTHGLGIEGAMSACRDLVQLWVSEKKANNEIQNEAKEEYFSTLEINEYAV